MKAAVATIAVPRAAPKMPAFENFCRRNRRRAYVERWLISVALSGDESGQPSKHLSDVMNCLAVVKWPSRMGRGRPGALKMVAGRVDHIGGREIGG